MKFWKRGANKKLRSKSKQLLNQFQEWDNFILPHRDEVDNRWNSPMDGRVHIEWIKPDNDNCIRDWSKHGEERWTHKWVPHNCNERQYTNHWERIEMPKLVNRHYKPVFRKNRWIIGCDCLCNKNSWYWKSFRK